jgi:HEAT repeat protein
MNPTDPMPTLDQAHSTNLILLVLGGLVVLALVLSVVGVIGWIGGLVARTIRSLVGLGFRVWARTLSWVGWLGFLPLTAIILAAGLAWIDTGFPYPAVPAAGLLIVAGAVTCLAYMHVSIERYEVSRGFKALHNPEKGQQLAGDLLRHGSQLGVPMLASAAGATVLSFALLNFALYESGGQRWYRFTDPEALPDYLDFLAYTFVNLLRVVDVFDFAKSYHFLNISLIRPVGPPEYLLLGFKSFFTLFLLQQVFASLRQGWLLAETVKDFWSPHHPVRERAKFILPQFGPEAVMPILVALRSASTLTQEQRDQLPAILAGIGPAAIPGLLRHLNDSHETSRAVAASALGLLKFLGAAPELARLVHDTSETVRIHAVEALGRIGEAHSNRNDKNPSPMAPRPKWWKRSASWARRAIVWKRLPEAKSEMDHVVEWIGKALQDSSPVVRGKAATAAGLVGSVAQNTLPGIIELLRNDIDDVRVSAAIALGKIRSPEHGAIPSLVAALDDPSSTIRIAAANALGEFRQDATEAVPALVGLLRDGEETVRTSAAEAISLIGVPEGDSTELLVRGLTSHDNVVRAQTAESLGQIGVAAELAAPALEEALTDANDRVRGKAAEALGRMGDAAGPTAVAALVRLLNDQDNWVRALAAEALGEMTEVGDDAGPALLRALSHTNPHVRANAAESLGKLRFESARPLLEAACSDPDPAVQSKAVQSLANFEPLTMSTRQVILEAAMSMTPEVRVATVDTLAGWATDWPEAVDTVISLIADGNVDVVVHAMQALQKFSAYPEAAVEAVLDRLRDSNDSWVQSEAAMTLSRMGPSAAPAGAELARVALTGDVELRQAAMRALAILQPEEALPAFLGGLRDVEVEVRKLAVAGLQKAGQLPADGVETVIETLRDPDLRVRTTAASILGQLEVIPPSAIPFLIENTAAANDDSLRLASTIALSAAQDKKSQAIFEALLQDKNQRVRLVAASSLLSTNPAHHPAKIIVSEALTDSSPRIQEHAKALIKNLSLEIPPREAPSPLAESSDVVG